MEKEHLQLEKNTNFLGAMIGSAIDSREAAIEQREEEIHQARGGLGGLWDTLTGQLPKPIPTLEASPLTLHDIANTLNVAETKTDNFLQLLNDRFPDIQQDPRVALQHLEDLVGSSRNQLVALQAQAMNAINHASDAANPLAGNMMSLNHWKDKINLLNESPLPMHMKEAKDIELDQRIERFKQEILGGIDVAPEKRAGDMQKLDELSAQMAQEAQNCELKVGLTQKIMTVLKDDFNVRNYGYYTDRHIEVMVSGLANTIAQDQQGKPLEQIEIGALRTLMTSDPDTSEGQLYISLGGKNYVMDSGLFSRNHGIETIEQTSQQIQNQLSQAYQTIKAPYELEHNERAHYFGRLESAIEEQTERYRQAHLTTITEQDGEQVKNIDGKYFATLDMDPTLNLPSSAEQFASIDQEIDRMLTEPRVEVQVLKAQPELSTNEKINQAVQDGIQDAFLELFTFSHTLNQVSSESIMWGAAKINDGINYAERQLSDQLPENQNNIFQGFERDEFSRTYGYEKAAELTLMYAVGGGALGRLSYMTGWGATTAKVAGSVQLGSGAAGYGATIAGQYLSGEELNHRTAFF